MKTATYNKTTKTFLYWNAKQERIFLTKVSMIDAKKIFDSDDCVAFYFDVAE